MACFHYKAKDIDGRNINGTAEAEDEDQLYRNLREEDLFLVKAKEDRKRVRKSPLSSYQLADFSRQMAVMLKSGIQILSAVNILKQREHNSGIAAVYENLFCLLSRGMSLSDAMEKQFKPVMDDLSNGVSLASSLAGINGLDEKLITGIFIGEESGELEDMLVHVADSFDYEAEAASKRLTVLIEPIMIVLIAVMTGYVMVSVILPIYQYYEMMG